MLNEEILVWLKLASFLERRICMSFEVSYLEQKETNFGGNIFAQKWKVESWVPNLSKWEMHSSVYISSCKKIILSEDSLNPIYILFSPAQEAVQIRVIPRNFR